MKISELADRRVAIWGYGREGRAALAALRWRLPRQPLALLCAESEAQDARMLEDPQLLIVTGEPTPEALREFEVVIKSPGISPYLEPAASAIAAGVRFTSGTALWFAEHPEALTICVTGTKGKSTTCALIAHLLRAGGHRTALAGNIGLPVLDLLEIEPPPDYWVIELSSYQTREAGFADVAVVLNLFPEHLDWHGSEARYVNDKLALIREGSPDRIVLNAADARLAALPLPGADVRWFSNADGWHPSGGTLMRGAEPVLDLGELPLPGTHNHRNLCAALTAIEALELDASALAPAAKAFQPLPHRLQSLGVREGIEYVNDSISTTPQAAVAALECYANRRVAIIVGGYDRGLDWSVFEEHVAVSPPHAVLAQGQNGPRIAAQLGATARKAHFELRDCADLEPAVRLAEKMLGGNGVVLLSPGAPSFPRYRDYVERGKHFARVAGFDPASIVAIHGLGVS
ncbi:MAG TPA: UDP-N-acetylmuramoyl-L-alanine--D-glutamate ligase [Xanthomonadaceae bacterium]|nr:UDP-N-acetylmuramoyl-L-alanine--D-glutamate ligase [Xanthomonadaceae bacterium]